MPSAMRPAILLVNQISRHGHLDMYARLYSACLLDLGYRVVLLAQDESGISEWLATRRPNLSSRFSFFSLNESQDTAVSPLASDRMEPFPPLQARIARVWRIEGVSGMARRLCQYARRSFDAALSTAFRRYGWIRRFRQARNNGLSFEPIVERIQAVQEQLGAKPALSVFLYLDMMNDEPSGCRSLGNDLGSPWAGILFHPRCHRSETGQTPEAYFSCSNSRGAAFLNPACVPEYTQRFPALRFAALPDVAEAERPQSEPELVRRLRERAAGRTIVLLSGCMSSPHKGVMEFIDVIGQANPRTFFFAIIGEVFWDAFPDHKERLRAFYAAPPENCLAQPGYIEDERDFNSVISATDIIYAVYRSWRNSSNSLTKASLFEKPILVSDGDLMGHRVTHYRIGASVRFGDIDGIIAALEELRQKNPSDFGFADFRREHSVDALREGLGKLVAAWMQTENSGLIESGFMR
jgi:hypothetical protein